MLHRGSMRLVPSSYSVLEVKKYFYIDIYKLQYGNKTSNINAKKRSSLKRSVRAINHTYKTAQIILEKILDRPLWL